MRRVGAKALLTALTLNRTQGRHPNWDTAVMLFSSLVTIGLIGLYVWGKASSRW